MAQQGNVVASVATKKEGDGGGALVTVAIIALLIGFGIGGWVWPGRGVVSVKNSGEDTDLQEESTDGEDVGLLESAINNTIGSDSTGPLALSANDQPAGATALISSVRLDDVSWVVIHEDEAGSPGRILGAKRLDAGTHAGVIVELLRGIEVGKTYYAMIHADDGDKVFDHKKDLARVDENGSPIAIFFKAK